MFGRELILRSCCLKICYYICILTLVSLTVGCSIRDKEINKLLFTATSQSERAKRINADKLAEKEFSEAQSLLAKARLTKNKAEKEILLRRAIDKFRLSEAVSKQVLAEQELSKLEAELKDVERQAESARLERQEAEATLRQLEKGNTQ